MRRYLILALAALALAIVAPSAFATRVIFDPLPIPAGPCTSNTLCSNIAALNQPYTVNFLPCSQLPSFLHAGAYSYCLWLRNVTGQTGHTFTFQFLVPSGGSSSGNTLQCSSIPQGLATNNCPQGLPAVQQPFTVSFFVPSLAIPSNEHFYLFTDFLTSPGTATVTVPVPEPGTLGLFGLGLLALGVGIGIARLRRRKTSRSNGAE